MLLKSIYFPHLQMENGLERKMKEEMEMEEWHYHFPMTVDNSKFYLLILRKIKIFNKIYNVTIRKSTVSRRREKDVN
jgi:hypothetical protein